MKIETKKLEVPFTLAFEGRPQALPVTGWGINTATEVLYLYSVETAKGFGVSIVAVSIPDIVHRTRGLLPLQYFTPEGGVEFVYGTIERTELDGVLTRLGLQAELRKFGAVIPA